MDQNEHEAVPVPPPAPPTYAGPIGPVGPTSRWPKVMGIISIILGAGGALGNCFGVVTPLLMGAFQDVIKDAMPQGAGPDPFATLEAVEKYIPWSIALQVLLLGLSVLLLVAGIALVRRRRWSIKGAAMWAILKILAGVPSAVLGYLSFKATMEAMQNVPNMNQMDAGMMSMMGSVGGMATVVGGLLWGCAFPAFILIWFSRRKIKEEVAGWE